MKKNVKVISLVAVLLVALAAVSPTFAQNGNPPADGEAGAGGRGRGGGGLIVQMAETLGLTSEEVQALLDSGMTMPEIFAQQGVEMPERPEREGEGGPGGRGGFAGQCELSREEIHEQLQAGASIEEICPGVDLQGPGAGMHGHGGGMHGEVNG